MRAFTQAIPWRTGYHLARETNPESLQTTLPSAGPTDPPEDAINTGSSTHRRDIVHFQVLTLRNAVEHEIRDLIRKRGQITFAEFMQACLYSPKGGFYSDRSNRINEHFGTSPASHPAFGALIARQLEQMWRLLGEPTVFHLVEVGSGDGGLAQAIVNACRLSFPQFARSLYYVAVDYQPPIYQSPGHALNRTDENDGAFPSNVQATSTEVHWVRADGLSSFRNVAGCILCNELLDNFPFHRFVIQEGNIKEVFLMLSGDNLVEVFDDPSSPAIEERLKGLRVSLTEGYRGEVCIALDDWAAQLSRALERGFVLTIDYGELAEDLYSPGNAQGTMVCYRQHKATNDPYRHFGLQDITCHVDFTSLIQLGEQYGLSTVGLTRQSGFLQNLGFSALLEGLRGQSISAARAEFESMALMTLVEPEEYGDFKVLAQAKGVGLGSTLLGFEGKEQ